MADELAEGEAPADAGDDPRVAEQTHAVGEEGLFFFFGGGGGGGI